MVLGHILRVSGHIIMQNSVLFNAIKSQHWLRNIQNGIEVFGDVFARLKIIS
jgi:hypothetical protein